MDSGDTAPHGFLRHLAYWRSGENHRSESQRSESAVVVDNGDGAPHARFVQVRENWKSRGKSENIFQSLESQGI